MFDVVFLSRRSDGKPVVVPDFSEYQNIPHQLVVVGKTITNHSETYINLDSISPVATGRHQHSRRKGTIQLQSELSRLGTVSGFT